MKKLIFIFMLFPLFTYGQFGNYTQKVDSSKLEICNERGHVGGGVVSSTAMYCPPYLQDLDTATYMIYPPCNYTEYRCIRCGKRVVEQEKERRVLIWRKTE